MLLRKYPLLFGSVIVEIAQKRAFVLLYSMNLIQVCFAVLHWKPLLYGKRA